MNTRTLRKSYENLSMFQRLALLDNAIGRDDESEANAIMRASPRKIFSQTDYCNIYEEITSIRLCNLIVRLSHILTFDFLMLAVLDNSTSKSSLRRRERLKDLPRLTAFLYVRATDSWNAVNDELGLRSSFDSEIGEILFAIDMLQWRDAMMREYAFSEDEAREYVFKHTGTRTITTVEQEIKSYREFLNLDSANTST